MAQRTWLRRPVLGLVLVGTAALAGCAQPPPPPPPSGAAPADATSTEGAISFSGGAVAAGIGFRWGSGTLTFRGAQYPFSMSGLSVIDVGITSVTGSGRVHNLHNVADFSGNYVAFTAGATVAVIGRSSIGKSTLINLLWRCYNPQQGSVLIDGIDIREASQKSLCKSDCR